MVLISLGGGGGGCPHIDPLPPPFLYRRTTEDIFYGLSSLKTWEGNVDAVITSNDKVVPTLYVIY